MDSKNKKNKTYITGFAVAFLLPLSFYIGAKLLNKDKIEMPRYYGIASVGEKVVDGKTVPDTVYRQVADLQLVNQMGEPVSLNNDLKGKILVLDFMYTDCPTICPKLTRNMALLQNAFRRTAQHQNDTVMQLVSISVLPERDSVPRLRAYADRFGVNHDRWYFTTGDKKQIYHYIREELGLSAGQGDGGADDFIHTQSFVLLDRDRNIRGIYDGTDSVAVGKCAYDIGLLAMEKKKKKK